MACPQLIVPDTSIFVADYWMRGASFAAVKLFLKRTDARLVLPAVVVEEVKNKYADHLRDEMKKFGKAYQQMERLANTGLPLENFQEQKLVDEFTKEFDRQLAEMKAEIIDYPDVPHQRLVERALRRRKPFSENGAGYRDALIWESVLQLATERGKPIAFLTGNTRDFGFEGNLHPHLIEDLRDSGANEASVRLYSLADYAEKCARPVLEELEREEREEQERQELLTRITAELEKGVFGGESLDERISLAIQEKYQPQEFSGGEMGFISEYETVSLDTVHGIDSYEVLEVDSLGEDEVYAHITVEALAEFYAFVFDADFYTLDDEYLDKVIDPKWNDRYLQLADTTSVTVEVELVLDYQSGEIKGLDVGDMSPTYQEQ